MSITNLIRDWIVDPIGLIFLLSMLWLLLALKRRFTIGRVLLMVLWFGVFAVMSAPRLVNPMLLHYENQYSSTPVCLANRPTVVLGGGADSRATSSDDIEFLDPPTYKRVVAGLELANRFSSNAIIVAGGALRDVSEAELMATFLRQSGVAANRIAQESKSKSTYQNAVNVRELLLNAKADLDINLVTSALHMPRAVAVFERQGMRVCPVGVDKQGLNNVPDFAWWPQITAMNKFDLLLHEQIATLLYKARGYL